MQYHDAKTQRERNHWKIQAGGLFLVAGMSDTTPEERQGVLLFGLQEYQKQDPKRQGEIVNWGAGVLKKRREERQNKLDKENNLSVSVHFYNRHVVEPWLNL